MLNVILVTQGTGGDVYPFIQIGMELNCRGHRVTMLVNSKYVPAAEQRGLACVSIDRLGEYPEWLQANKLKNSNASIEEYLKRQVIWIRNLILDTYILGQTVIVGHYGLHLALQLTVDSLGTQYIPVFTSPYFMPTTGTSEDQYRRSSTQLNLLRQELGLPRVDDWGRWLRSPNLGIGLWPEWYAPPERDWISGVRLVGFVLIEESAKETEAIDAINFLKAGSPPILITHGTSIPQNPAFFSLAVMACNRLGQRCLVVTQNFEPIVGCLDENVHYRSYVPFSSLLPSVRAVIHHGGIGISGLALDCGIPQLILAEGADRPDNARRLENLGVAKGLAPKDWTVEAIGLALNDLLTSASIRRNCNFRANYSDQTNAVLNACFVIESSRPL